MPGLSTLSSPTQKLSPPAMLSPTSSQQGRVDGIMATDTQDTTTTSQWSTVNVNINPPILRHQRSTTLPRIPPSTPSPPKHDTTSYMLGRNRSTSVSSRIAQLDLDFLIVGGGK
jgi:hypothetical protein